MALVLQMHLYAPLVGHGQSLSRPDSQPPRPVSIGVVKPVTTESQADRGPTPGRRALCATTWPGSGDRPRRPTSSRIATRCSGEVTALVPLSGADDVDAAVRAAREAQPAWRDLAPQRRARAIMRLRQELVSHQEELARLVTDDMGKTIDDARGEVGRGIESVEAATAIPHLLKGENLEGVARGVDVEQIRQPVGVVAAITPFNFPAMIPLWFLPFALACGNGFILKPSERDPRPSELIYELIDGDRRDPGGDLQPRPRRPGRRQRVARPPRDRRDLVRRPGLDRPVRRQSAPRPPASGARRWAAPRTRSSSCPTPTSS